MDSTTPPERTPREILGVDASDEEIRAGAMAAMARWKITPFGLARYLAGRYWITAVRGMFTVAQGVALLVALVAGALLLATDLPSAVLVAVAASAVVAFAVMAVVRMALVMAGRRLGNDRHVAAAVDALQRRKADYGDYVTRWMPESRLGQMRATWRIITRPKKSGDELEQAFIAIRKDLPQMWSDLDAELTALAQSPVEPA